MQIHLKAIVTFAFICGFASLVVKILDEKLPDKTKERFGVWIAKTSQRLNSLEPDHFYTWTKANWVMVSACFVAILMLSEVLIFSRFGIYQWLGKIVYQPLPGDPDAWKYKSAPYTMPSFFSLIFGIIALKDFAEGDSWETAKRAFRKSLVHSPISAVVIAILAYAYLFHREIRNLSPLEVLGTFTVVLCAVTMLFFFMGAITIAPFAMFIMIRILFTVCSKPVRWLATYPKGAWAGVVFVLTIGLGLLRLIM